MKLKPEHIKRAVKFLPSVLVELMRGHGKNLVVAGGFLRCIVSGEPIKDIDCFTTSPAQSKGFQHIISASYVRSDIYNIDPYEEVNTKNAYSVRNVGGYFVQFIHRWTFQSPEFILKSFDFTFACAALWWDAEKEEWDSLVHETFYEDLAEKKLVYLSPTREEDPAGSLIRVLKFNRLGYDIPTKSLAGVVARLSKKANEDDIIDCGIGTTYNEEKWSKILTKCIATCTGES